MIKIKETSNNIGEQNPEIIQANSKSDDETKGFIGHVDPYKKNSAVPPVPKPGEIMHCQICRKPMLPEDFSKDPAIRKREFKWHVHEACRNYIVNDYLDRITPGIMAERNPNKKNILKPITQDLKG